MGIFRLILLFIGVLFFISLIDFTVRADRILINEFSIEPNQAVEILNSSSDSANISNWYLDDAGGTTYFTIPKETILSPNSCQIFQADLNLNKSSPDTLRLFDNSSSPTSSSANLIDSYSYKSSPGLNQSFFRLPDGGNNWSSGSASLGKFNSTGISCIAIPPSVAPTNTPSLSPTSEPTPTIFNVPYNNIYISEFMAAPLTGEAEWVELFNANDFEVVLNDWYIDDIENGGSTPKVFTTLIGPKSYAVIDLTSAVLNDAGDTVRLLDFNKVEKDSTEYKGARKNVTFARHDFNGDDFCLTAPSKNTVNNDCLLTPTPTPTSIIKPTNIVKVENKPEVFPSPIFTSSTLSDSYEPEQTGQVLGTKNFDDPNQRLLKSLLFAASAHSLLTIFAVLFRMKKEAILLWEKSAIF